MLIKELDCYTLVIEKLIASPMFKIVYLEVLLLHKCEAVPNLKTGMAIDKCSTACIKELSKLMMQIKDWKLIESLIKHGTVPDVKCVEISIEKHTEDRALYILEQLERKGNHNFPYNHLLSSAICKKWNDKFVSHCLKKGAQFTAKTIWMVLHWKNSPEKDNLFKVMVSKDGVMDLQNDKGQLPLEFLLEQGRLKNALTLLELNIDTSKMDIIKTIKILKKFTAD